MGVSGGVNKRSLRRALLWGLLLVTIACATRRPGDPIRPGFNLFSKEQDIQLGREAAAQISRQLEILDNPAVQDYVRDLGRRLAATPYAGDFPYSFTVVKDPTINAFALPGGPVFIHTGLIAAADNEAQLAGVMGHEISHVALRHATNQVSKANIVRLPAILASNVIGQGSLLAELGQVGLSLGVNSLLLRYSRQAESEADSLGVRIMASVGYNPLELAHFFEKLEADGGSRAPEFLSSHPNPGNRRKNIMKEVRTLPQRQYITDKPEFHRIKQMVPNVRSR